MGDGHSRTLDNCVLTGNWAGEAGGGAYACTLNHCTVSGNTAGAGAGIYGCNALNSIIYFNDWGPNWQQSGLAFSCTTPLPPSPGDQGDIESDPRFVNAAGGDFRLRSDSPCIDAATNVVDLEFNDITTDILGLPRPLDGNGDGVARFDMGAYEFDPHTLRFAPALQLNSNGFTFTIQGEPGRSVRIERSRNLVDWEHVATVPIPANGQTLIDPVATSEPFLFYRAVSVP
jgi:hypothetical protein